MILALIACEPFVPAAPPVVAPVVVAPPVATPAMLRVVNDTDAVRSFDITFGPYQAFGLGRLDGALDPSTLFGPCVCACGTPCISAARPEQETARLEPGGSLQYAWDGQLIRSGGDLGPCCETFVPPSGRYVVTACADEGGCARVEVDLPAAGPIVIPLSASASASTCAAVDLARHQDAVARFVSELAPVLRDRPVAGCPTARCVEPGDLQAALDASRGDACTVFVIPGGNEVETRAFLPLPPGHAGGESYSRFTDPDFTRVFRVRYEQ